MGLASVELAAFAHQLAPQKARPAAKGCGSCAKRNRRGRIGSGAGGILGAVKSVDLAWGDLYFYQRYYGPYGQVAEAA